MLLGKENAMTAPWIDGHDATIARLDLRSPWPPLNGTLWLVLCKLSRERTLTEPLLSVIAGVPLSISNLKCMSPCEAGRITAPIYR